MEYNKLKIRVLSLFDTTVELDSRVVLERISSTAKLSDKAIEMALMRYWRQGLLSRSRKGRRFSYKLTEKGIARKRWLLRAT